MTIKFSTTSGNFFNALVNAAHFTANPDERLPMLSAVHIRYNKATRSLTANATDRYKIIAVKIEENFDMDENFAFSIPLEAVKNLNAKLRGFKKFQVPGLDVEVTDDVMTTTYNGHEKEISTLDIDSEYPKLDPLFRGAFAKTKIVDTWESPTTGHKSMASEHLAAVTKLKNVQITPTERRQNEPTRLATSHSGSKLLFQVGGWAFGIVMPVRDTGALTELPAWLG